MDGGGILLIIGVFALLSCVQNNTGSITDIKGFALSYGDTKTLLASDTKKTFEVDKATTIPATAKVVYSLVTSPTTDKITIDKTTGVITTAAGLTINTYTLKITATAGANPAYTGTKLATLKISIVKNLATYKPDPTQSASIRFFTIGDIDNPYLIQIEGTGVKDTSSLGDIKLKIAGNEIHAVKTFMRGGKIVVGIGPKAKLSFATLLAKFDITIEATVGTEKVNQKFTLTKAALGDIYSWRDLTKVRDNLGGAYTLKSDIAFPADNTYGYGTKFTPIGNETTKFTGKLDGNNKTISGLKIIETTNHVGLFGYVSGSTAEIKDLIIDHVGISGGKQVGSIAGKVDDNAKITNVGMISTSNKQVEGSVTDVGGLVGWVKGATVTGYATGPVSGKENVGGLVGDATDSATINGYATGPVAGSDNNVGGLVGHAKSGTINGYAKGSVSGKENVGGLVGLFYGNAVTGYATGDVSGNIGVGGLVGIAYSGVTTGYATGSVSGEKQVGGLVGGANSSVTIAGYARNTIRRTSGTDTKFGKFVGFNAASIIGKGYNSKGESKIVDKDDKFLTLGTATTNGTAIEMGAGITKDSFVHFKIGEAGSKWEWVKNGSWPAIDIGTIKPKGEQPVQ
jgi:hypothetical protein